MTLSHASILFVDDEPGIRDIFEKWLTHAGCASVTTCADGEQALAALTSSHFDLLISDIRMPKIDGVTLVRRRHQAGSRVPCVLFISGFGDIVPREMYALGVEAFLPKPTRREEFFRTIGRSLAERCELWRAPVPPLPRQFLTNRTLNPPALTPSGPAPQSPASLPLIGRGGFSLPCSRPLALGKVGFDLAGAPGHPPLRGEGVVRWRSKDHRHLGVEFEWLDPVCREAVLEHIAATRPDSFIPDPTQTHPDPLAGVDKPFVQNASRDLSLPLSRAFLHR